jgi:hypothetical protein
MEVGGISQFINWCTPDGGSVRTTPNDGCQWGIKAVLIEHHATVICTSFQAQRARSSRHP